MGVILHLLWPDFWTQVYPNVLASLLWATPAFIGQHVAMRRHHSRVLAAHVEALRRAETAIADRILAKVAS